jgi:hypothetical protein
MWPLKLRKFLDYRSPRAADDWLAPAADFGANIAPRIG